MPGGPRAAGHGLWRATGGRTMFRIPTGTQACVFHSLLRSPSRASAAAIGQQYVLRGASPALRMLGIDALAQMPCDWSVAILEQAIYDPSRGYNVRRHAIHKLRDLLSTAICDGYAPVSADRCQQWAQAAGRELMRQCIQGGMGENPAIEELCSHLSQAIADGHLGHLPDF